MRKPSNIGRHELIGLRMEVVSATDSSLVGTVGTITDETKNTLLVERDGKDEVRVPKRGTVIRVQLDDKDVELDCNKIMYRPEDRIKRVKR